MSKEKTEITIESLPNDMLVEILKYLSQRDIYKVSQVSKRFLQLSISNIELAKQLLNFLEQMLPHDLYF
ncbi:F-box protein [Legionella israelensis]|uniref:F-box protein n=1 Tax=Legionella israelensis TaxID=454 RepID=UPI00117E22EE|nr:F-box protein [Legionella israelensis]